jgi:hypothetical protein
MQKEMEAYNKSFGLQEIDEQEEEWVEEHTPVYQFLKSLFCVTSDWRATPGVLDHIDLNSIVEELVDLDLGAYHISTNVMENYADNFKLLFPEGNRESFIFVTYELLEILELEVLPYHKIFNSTIILINKMIENFIQDDKPTG